MTRQKTISQHECPWVEWAADEVDDLHRVQKRLQIVGRRFHINEEQKLELKKYYENGKFNKVRKLIFYLKIKPTKSKNENSTLR